MINSHIGQELPELTPVEIDISRAETNDIGLSDEWLTLFVKSFVLIMHLSMKQEATRSLVVW